MYAGDFVCESAMPLSGHRSGHLYLQQFYNTSAFRHMDIPQQFPVHWGWIKRIFFDFDVDFDF
jgi:hypothetical protein